MFHTVIHDCKELGDALMTTPALRQLSRELPERHRLRLLVRNLPNRLIFGHNPHFRAETAPDDLLQLYGQMPPGEWTDADVGPCVRLAAGTAFDYSVARGGKLHLAEGFAVQLGVTLDSLHYDLRLNYADQNAAIESWNHFNKGAERNGPTVLCAPYSTNCHSRKGGVANKMVPWPVWEEVYARLREDFSLWFLAGEGEPPAFAPDRWLVGYPIRTVAAWLPWVAAVVAVDNGLGHVAQAMDASIVSIVAATAPAMVSLSATRGRFQLIDHHGMPGGILGVAADEIVDAVRRITTV